MNEPGDRHRSSEIKKLSPLGPAKVTASPPKLPEVPEEFKRPVPDPEHGLRDFLYKTFLLPMIGVGSFAPAPEIPNPSSQMVQMAPGGVRKAAEPQTLAELIRTHSSRLGDPEHASRVENLRKAIETVAAIPEKVSDEADVVDAMIDAYVALERKSGKDDKDIGEVVKKMREWQELK